MNFGRAFDRVADLYAEVRPGYLPALFDDLVAMGALGPSKAVLEVGCGGGQATGDLVRRADQVIAVDPGAQLVANARRLTEATNVAFEVSTFEDFEAAPGSFDLIASAQAWHWVDPKVGFAKAAEALRPGGHLAIFGHVPMMVTEALQPAFRAAFDTYWPGVWGQPSPQTWYLPGGAGPRYRRGERAVSTGRTPGLQLDLDARSGPVRPLSAHRFQLSCSGRGAAFRPV